MTDPLEAEMIDSNQEAGMIDTEEVNKEAEGLLSIRTILETPLVLGETTEAVEELIEEAEVLISITREEVILPKVILR